MDRQPSRAVWPPEPGCFALQLVKRGYRVPARIIREAAGSWRGEIDGAPGEPHPDPALAPGVATIWHGGRRISEEDYSWMVAMKEHARAHDPDHPCLHPRRPVDHRTLAPIMPGQR